MKRRIPVDQGALKLGELELPPRAAHYARQVLRLGPGAEVELFDGEGRAARGEITQVQPEAVLVTIDQVWAAEPSRPRIRLYQCIPKGDRWELLIEKATELGVNEIIPVTSQRTVVKVPDSKLVRKLERWNRIALAASRQCGRYHAPTVAGPTEFSSSLATDDSELKLFGNPLATREDLEQHLVAEPASIGLWIGPEGGFSDEELKDAADRGARPFHLGQTVLRSETAGIFAVGLIRYLAGGSA